MRFKTSFLIGLSALLGAWLNLNQINKIFDELFLTKIISVFLLTFFSSGSLNLFNDITDLEIDKELKPERILPRGIISIQKAYIFLFLTIIVCFTLAFNINLLVVAIYTTMLVIGIAYSLFFQKIPLVKNFIVGLSISTSILVGYLSIIVNSVFVLSNKILIIFTLSLFSIVCFELQKDINDVEIDRKFNKRTFPVVFGKKYSSVLTYAIYWVLVFILWIYLLLITIYAYYYLIILLIIVQSYVLYSIRNIITDQSFSAMERARIRIYFLFAITMVFLFLL